MIDYSPKKYCPRCCGLKDKSQFRKNKSRKDGVSGWCKSCAKKDDADYRLKNSINEDWTQNRKEYAKKWWQSHPEEYRKNLEQFKEWGRANRNIEKERKKYREWRLNNPEKAAAIKRNRRAKKINNGGKISAKEWQNLKNIYNHACLCCGKREPEIKLSLDHVIPLSIGGSNKIENAQPLCCLCNSKKGIKVIDYREITMI